MPYMTNGRRDYKKEHEWEIGKRGKANRGRGKQRNKVRARNNKANRDAGTYGNKDGKDVAHSKPKARGSTKIQSASKNRSIPRTKSGKRKR